MKLELDLSQKQWQRILAVYTGEDLPDDPQMPAVMGTYQADEAGVRFVPRFPWAAGVAYVARFSPSALTDHSTPAEADVLLRFSIPPLEVHPSTVAGPVYPSASELPMNLLKFYIHFSAPMSLGEAYRNIRLLDENGYEVPDAFLIMQPELWDPQRKRFTLLFDPGRIKRGLAPHRQLGLPLQAGRSYRLVIGTGWRDAQGNPLLEGLEKPFRVVGPDYRSPRPQDWALTPPGKGEKKPLLLEFPEPLDHALLGRLLRVEDPQGRPVEGRIEISGLETKWAFYPAEPWQPGRYRLRIGSWLEDLAGNNLRRPFDTDLRRHPQEEDVRSEVELTFDVR